MCAVPTGLRDFCDSAFPALKRWANILCAYGAGVGGLRDGEGPRAVGWEEAGGGGDGGRLLAEGVADEKSDRGVGVVARVVGGKICAGEPVRPDLIGGLARACY